jgi:hypothetical protein
MSFSQDAIALLLVFAALFFLFQRVWRLFFRRTRGCGGCAACPAPAEEEGRPMVSTISPLPSPADGTHHLMR